MEGKKKRDDYVQRAVLSRRALADTGCVSVKNDGA